MTLPNLIIGGAPKCGTSSLYFWLAAHPDACASRVKETFYFADEVSRFNKNSNFPEHGLSGYASHFKHCEGAKVIFEATAPYIYYRNALEQIPALPGPPRMIFILREPAARAYSKFKFNKFKLKKFDGNFSQYVRGEDDLFGGRHVEEGKYARYLIKWRHALPEGHILLLEFENLMEKPAEVMEKVAGFLGIDPVFYRDFNFSHRNETVNLKSKGLHNLGLKFQKYIPHRLQEKMLPLYMKLNSGTMPGKSREEKEIMAELKKYYMPYNQELMKHFPDLQLTAWDTNG